MSNPTENSWDDELTTASTKSLTTDLRTADVMPGELTTQVTAREEDSAGNTPSKILAGECALQERTRASAVGVDRGQSALVMQINAELRTKLIYESDMQCDETETESLAEETGQQDSLPSNLVNADGADSEIKSSEKRVDSSGFVISQDNPSEEEPQHETKTAPLIEIVASRPSDGSDGPCSSAA